MHAYYSVDTVGKRLDTIENFQHVDNTCHQVATTPTPPYQLTPQIIRSTVSGCRSHKNLAGRLAARIFTEDELLESNFRGVCNKKKLDEINTNINAIRKACLTEYPIQSHENSYIVERDIREGADEMGRRMKRQKIMGLGKENYDLHVM